MSKRRGWDEGAVAVEGAIALGVLITLALGIIEFGIAFYNLNTMQLVIEEVGRYAMVNCSGDTSCGGAVTYGTRVLGNYSVMNGAVSASYSGSGPTMMTITGSFTTLNLLVTVPAMSTQITVPLT